MIRKYSAGPESISPHFRPFGNDVRIENRQAIWIKKMTTCPIYIGCLSHGLRTPREEIAFTARPKIHSHSQFFRYCGSLFCLPYRPDFSDIFDLCLHWVSVVRGLSHSLLYDIILKDKCQYKATIPTSKILLGGPIIFRTTKIWSLFWF